MAGFNETEMAVADLYAASLYEVAKEKGAVETLLEELQAFSSLLAGDAGFRTFLASPLVDDQERGAAIEKVFRGRASDLLVDGLQVVNRKGRSALLPAIAEAYRRVVDRAAGRVDVQVRSAVALDDRLRDELRAAVRKISGREARLYERVDPSLLAGMVVQVGDRKFDTSASAALGRLEASLLDRASRQILQGTGGIEG